MRWEAVGGLLLLVVAAAWTSGSIGAVEGREPPTAMGGGGLCLPACSTPSSAAAFLPPVQVVESGATMTWTSFDNNYHTVTADEGCVDLRIFADRPASATFEIREAALYAQEAGAAPWVACTGATAVAGGAFVLAYECLFHPFQAGRLVVAPRLA